MGLQLLDSSWPPALTDGADTADTVAATLLVAHAAFLGGLAPRMSLWAWQFVRCLGARRPKGVSPRWESKTELLGKSLGVRILPWEVGSVVVVVIVASVVTKWGFDTLATFVWPDAAPEWWLRSYKVHVFALICTAPGLLALRYAYIIGHIREWRQGEPQWSRDVVIGVLRFVRSRTSLTLNVLGLVVTSAVITIGSVLSYAAHVVDDAQAEVPATELTLMAGLVLTLSLAVVYLPPVSHLDVLARFITTSWLPVGDQSTQNDTLGARDRLMDELRAEQSGPQSLISGTVIVGPLLASVLQTFVT